MKAVKCFLHPASSSDHSATDLKSVEKSPRTCFIDVREAQTNLQQCDEELKLRDKSSLMWPETLLKLKG